MLSQRLNLKPTSNDYYDLLSKMLIFKFSISFLVAYKAIIYNTGKSENRFPSA